MQSSMVKPWQRLTTFSSCNEPSLFGKSRYNMSTCQLSCSIALVTVIRSTYDSGHTCNRPVPFRSKRSLKSETYA